MVNTLHTHRTPVVAIRGRSTAEAIAQADVVVIEHGDERELRAAAGELRRGQMLLVEGVVGVGVVREQLVVPLEARDVELGTEAYVAVAPAGDGPRVVAGATPECADRAAALIEGAGGQALVVDSLEAAELSGLHRDLAGAETLVEAASAAAQVEEALEEQGTPREEASVLVVGDPGPPTPALLTILDGRGIRTAFTPSRVPAPLDEHDLVLVIAAGLAPPPRWLNPEARFSREPA